MKRIVVFLSFALVLAAASSVTGKTIAAFKKKQYMIGPDIQFSPDRKNIAFTAKDGKKYYSPSYLYKGSAVSGRFKKAFSDPVSQYVWKSGSEIVYAVAAKDSVTVKSGNPLTGRTKNIFSRKLKMTGSGYSRGYEKFAVRALSPSGEFMIAENGKRECVLVNISTGKEIVSGNFTIPYSGNPQSTLKFSGDSKRLLLFDGKKRIYTIYEVSLSGFKKIRSITSIKKITPGSDYVLNSDGTEIAFTEEKCKGGCYHIVYIYNIDKNKLYRNITIRSGQILHVGFDRNFSKAVINNMHRKLEVFTLNKNGREVR